MSLPSAPSAQEAAREVRRAPFNDVKALRLALARHDLRAARAAVEAYCLDALALRNDYWLQAPAICHMLDPDLLP